ncbi:MAG: hypothetical protein ABH828_01015 [archaeon]
MPYTKKFAKTEEGYEMLRGERRSFFCPNKLWEELLSQCHGIMSVSEFVKQAIIEKLIKEEPEKEEYFKELLF